MLVLVIFLSISFHAILQANAYKALVLSPTVTRSHMISTGRVADVLASDGHNVTVLELHYAFKPGSVKAVSVANLWKHTFDWQKRPKSFLAAEHTGNILHETTIIEYIQGNYAFQELLAEGCLASLKDGTLIEEIKRQKFDVIMMEQLDWCAEAISHLAGVKTTIWLSSCPIMEHMSFALALPAPYSYVPTILDNTSSDQMNIWERFMNIILGSTAQYLFSYGARTTKRLLDEHFKVDLPDLTKIAADSPLIFTNIDDFLTFPRPQASNIINIGGLGLNGKQEPLKSPFKELMDNAKNGVIYFALGSVLPTHYLPVEFRKNLLQAFNNTKEYQFIVKISEEDKESREIVSEMPNVYLTTWAPQASIIAHPNLKLFIAHGGYNSLLEAARFGVPMLLIPLANDGYSNSRLVERNQWGLYFEKTHLLHSHTELQSAIQKMLNDPGYKERALRTQQLFINKPMSAEQKLTKYVRLLEMSGELPELQSIARKLSFIELYNLDVFFILFLLFLFIIYCSFRVLKCLLSMTFGHKLKSE